MQATSGATAPGLLERARFWSLGISPALLAYLALMAWVGQLRWEHFAILVPTALAAQWPRARPVLALLLPFLLFALSYDLLRFIIPHALALIPPHVDGPYQLELSLFGIPTARGVVTPNEFFRQHTALPVDLVAAFAYVFFLGEVFLFVLWGLLRDRPLLRRFGWAFLVLNLLGYLTYLIYPAAPPWYVELYGLGPAWLEAPSWPARLAAVDQWLGIAYFQGVYGRASDVFGAVPSLHAAYPVLVWLMARRVFPRGHWLLLGFAALVWFAAVYLRHHYVIDVLLGGAFSVAVYFGAEALARRRQPAGVRVGPAGHPLPGHGGLGEEPLSRPAVAGQPAESSRKSESCPPVARSAR